MLGSTLANFYERDFRKLIEELNLFKNEEDLWRTNGSVKNSGGNLALHIIGGMNHLIGTQLAQTGYIRNRELEFTIKGVARKEIIAKLEELILLVSKTINALTQEQMDTDYPILFDDRQTSVTYVLVQLLAHLNYHLGQVNYLRRSFE